MPELLTVRPRAIGCVAALVVVLAQTPTNRITASSPAQVPATPPINEALQAQARIPSVRGRVTDPDGRPIAGAAVNYTYVVENLRGGVMTNAAGEFSLRFGIQGSAASGWFLAYTGPHRFEVSAPGYRTWIGPVVNLEAGKTARLDVALEPHASTAPALLSPAEYGNRAVESVGETLRLRKVPLNDVRIEPIADADIAPDHAALHRRGSVPNITSSMPDALVRVGIWRGKRFDQTVTVVFRGTGVRIEPSYNGSEGFLPLEEEEWRQVAAALEPFYTAAVDAGQGWQRFLPFFPDDMRKVLRRDRPKMRLFLTPKAVNDLSQDDLRKFAALTFDAALLRVWVEFEGGGDFQVAGGINDIFRTVSNAQDPRALVVRLEESLGRVRERLQSLGAFDEEHLARSAGYLRRMIGEGLVTREAPGRDGITGLPRGARMYSPPLGGWSAAYFPHLIIADGRPMLVAVDLP